MKRKIEHAVEEIIARISEWESVDTITVVESGEDLYDPYFFISFDVFLVGAIPDEDARRAVFSEGVAFEALQNNRKDRFLLDDIPFRIEYKDVSRFTDIVHGAKASESLQRDAGTYVFYRLRYARVVYQQSDWLDQVRSDLDSLDDQFWEALRASLQASMEHSLGDLSAATVRDDALFFLVSAAGFIRSLCSVLFAVNKRFEPSGRALLDAVRELPILPDPFLGRFESFLQSDNASMPPERKREIAELMARSVLSL